MKTKTLALISGLVGLIGGTILLLSNIFFVPFSALLGDSGLNLLGAVIKLAAADHDLERPACPNLPA